MNKIDKLVATIKESEESKDKKKTSPYDIKATVKRIEGGTAWVGIDGGVEETPASMLVNAKVGEEVMLRVAGGKAYVTGNATSPPTDDSLAQRAENNAVRAQNAADKASAQAEVADKASKEAVADAKVANESATTAKRSADNAVRDAGRAYQAAQDAQASADEAQASATEANNHANNALTQLSTVESVVDTLNWISEHSTFVLTEDTTVVSGKTYYKPVLDNLFTIDATSQTKDGITYVIDTEEGTIIANGTADAVGTGTFFNIGVPNVTAGETFYFSGCTDGANQKYELRYGNGPSSVSNFNGVSEATAIADRPFYIYIHDGVTVNNVMFKPKVSLSFDEYDYEIATPTSNPSAEGFYELSTDEAVKTYVQSHLALTNEGLYVLSDSNGWKVLIKNDGIEIQDDTGATVANYGSTVTIGEEADGKTRVVLSDDGMRIIHRDGSSDSINAVFGYGDTICGNGQIRKGAYLSLGGDQSSIGQLSLSAGIMCRAAGAGSIATGFESTADGKFSATFGNNTNSGGACSFSYGEYIYANGICSFGGGSWSKAGGDYSFANGEYINTNYDYQTAFGKHNDNKASNLFEIGNGTSSSARSNAFEVDSSGNVNIPSGAKYKINGTALSASDVGAVPTARTVNGKALSSNITLSASDVSALASADLYTRSSAGTVDWSSDTANKIMAKSAIAFWNGAYSGTSSNLKYCTNGVMIGGSQILREGKNFNCTAQSLSAQGGSQQVNCTMTKSGWFPIGLAGVNTSLPTGVVVSKYYMYSYATGSATIYITVTNTKTSAVSLTTSHIVAPYVIWAKVS